MARPDGSIVIDTKILTDGFNKGIAGLKSASGVAARAIGASIATAGAAVGAFAARGIKLASDLQEIQNVVDVTFGKSAKTIDKWAKDAGKNYGLSELQAKKYTSTTGAMLKSTGLNTKAMEKMSVGVGGLVGDFASFYNLEHEEAFEKIRSGLAGESEPLRQLGIDLSDTALQAFAASQGIKKKTSEMSQAEKVQLRYNMLLKQSSDAQGDFARTSDSFANQLRTAKMEVDAMAASLGTKLLPDATKALSGFRKMLSGEAGGAALFSEGVKGMASTLTQTITLVLPGLVSALTMVFTELAAALPDIITAITPALILGMSQLALVLPDVLPQFVTAFTGLLTSLAEAIPSIQGPMIQAMVALIVSLATQLGLAAPQIIPPVISAFIKMVPAIKAQLPRIATAALVLIGGLAVAMWNAITSQITTKMRDKMLAPVKAIQNTAKWWETAGSNLVEGLWNGITGKFDWLTTQLKTFASNVTDKLKEFFHIKSPSKLFEDEIGVNLALGIGSGFSKASRGVFGQMTGAVSSEMGRFSSLTTPSFSGGSAAASTASPMVVNFNQRVRTYSETVRAMSDIQKGLVV